MATKIRLRRTGTKNEPSYRIVVSDTRFPRDGRFIEVIGHYNPRKAGDDKVTVSAERVVHWIGAGAQISEAVRPLLKLKGVPLPMPGTRKARSAKTKAAAAKAAAEQAAPAQAAAKA